MGIDRSKWFVGTRTKARGEHTGRRCIKLVEQQRRQSTGNKNSAFALLTPNTVR